jgi:hypothetical protein
MAGIPLHPIDGGAAGPPMRGDPDYMPTCELCERRVSHLHNGLCDACQEAEAQSLLDMGRDILQAMSPFREKILRVSGLQAVACGCDGSDAVKIARGLAGALRDLESLVSDWRQK